MSAPRTHKHIEKTVRRRNEYRAFAPQAAAVATHHTAQLVCEICQEILEIADGSGVERRAVRDAIDHCHDTGAYRGRLCQPCNTYEGQARARYANKPHGFWLMVEAIAEQRKTTVARVAAYLSRPQSGSAPMDTRDG
jgi:DUF971 family protein